MGVYIKGMEMPGSCGRCFLKRRNGIEFFCPAANENFSVADFNIMACRLDRCPLVPVPPHGDLIDREPFVQFIKTHWDSYDQWFVEQLEARPTIIPDESEEEGET